MDFKVAAAVAIINNLQSMVVTRNEWSVYEVCLE